MSRSLSPEERAEEATFRRLCRVLGMHGTSERCKKRRRNALVQLKALGNERQQALFARVWEQEESRRRWRLRLPERVRFFFLFFLLLGMLVLLYTDLVQHIKGVIPFLTIYPSILMVVKSGIDLWSMKTSRVQCGMGRLLLRQHVTQADVGRLVEITRFHPKGEQEFEEINLSAMQHLTRLLPTLSQTDTMLLDDYHKQVLRRWVVGAAEQLTGKNPPTLRGANADFAAAALVALGTTAGWQETTKESRAARAAVQKLADAAPRPEEPLNHRYIREMARESLPLVQNGQRQTR